MKVGAFEFSGRVRECMGRRRRWRTSCPHHRLRRAPRLGSLAIRNFEFFTFRLSLQTDSLGPAWGARNPAGRSKSGHKH